MGGLALTYGKTELAANFDYHASPKHPPSLPFGHRSMRWVLSSLLSGNLD